MKITDKKISTLKPYKLNAKRHPQSQIDGLAESIKRFGFTQPVVLDKAGTIIIGHGRVEAAKAAGIKSVPCVIMSDLTADEVRALRLIDNRISETGWDQEVLKIELADLGFELAPFSVDFSNLIPRLEEEEAPKSFKEVGYGIETQHECPKCHYQWSGSK